MATNLRFPVPTGNMPTSGPQPRPRPMVRPGPIPQLGGNANIQRRVGPVAPPRQVAFLRQPARATMPFRPTGQGGSQLSVAAMFGDGGLGASQSRAPGSYRCIGRPDPVTGQPRPCGSQQGGLGVGLTMGIDDYMMTGGIGPLCENCWADAWVIHNMQNNPNMPQCKFGVQWTEGEWNQMQRAIHETIRDYTSTTDEHGRQRVDPYGRAYQPRYPSPEEMNQVLKAFKWSRECPRCAKLLQGAKVPVAFTPDVNDFRIAGVNTPPQ